MRLRPCVRFQSLLAYFSHLPPLSLHIMAKAQDPRKEKKKEPTLTTKEKKAAKDEKKKAKESRSE